MASLLFFCKAPMNAVMFERPLRRLWTDPRLRIRFTGEGGSGGRARGGADAPGILAALGFAGARAAGGLATRWRVWDAYVSPDIWQPARRARRAVQIFHGVSFKGKMYTPGIRRFSDLFLVGEDMRRRFVAKGLFPEEWPGFHRIGMPKLDAFFDGSLDREAILREAGADPARPVVLYAPTWRPESSLYSHGVEFMRRAAARDGWTLLIKLHDWAWNPATNPIDWRRVAPELEGPRVRFARGANVVPYLFAADLLVSDASSVANEYLLLNRPIVWIDVPDLIRKYEKTIDLDGWGRKTGRIVGGVDELLEACDAALAKPGELSATRRAAAADIFYNPGRATDAFIDGLYGLLELASR
ncbi:MAG: CDP-glycerol glycerophosphotransferase family protein [bacterium]|nr:CDP-glycerol glycerophosphotransferase family protein [bacterium]